MSKPSTAEQLTDLHRTDRDEQYIAPWEYKALGELLAEDIRNGYSPNCPEQPTGKWILGLGAAAVNGFDPSAIKPAPTNDPLVDKFLLRPGDFLVSRSNTRERVGLSCVYRGEVPNCSYPDLLMRFRVDPEQVDEMFLEQFLRSRESLSYLQKAASGTSKTMVKITGRTLARLMIPLPQKNEQRKIAEILSCWDKCILQLAQSLESKRQHKNAVLQRIYSRFSRRGDWCKISDYLVTRDERQPKSDTLPLYSLTIEDGVTPKSDRYDREKLVKDTSGKKYKVVHPNDIVFNPANLRWGAIGISNESHKVLVSPIYEILTCKDPSLKDFVFQFLSSPRQIALFATMTEGTLVERMAVKVDVFLQCDIPVSKDISECRSAGKLLRAFDEEIRLLTLIKQRLTRQKQALMQKLLTGKIRVKV